MPWPSNSSDSRANKGRCWAFSFQWTKWWKKLTQWQSLRVAKTLTLCPSTWMNRWTAVLVKQKTIWASIPLQEANRCKKCTIRRLSSNNYIWTWWFTTSETQLIRFEKVSSRHKLSCTVHLRRLSARPTLFSPKRSWSKVGHLAKKGIQVLEPCKSIQWQGVSLLPNKWKNLE